MRNWRELGGGYRRGCGCWRRRGLVKGAIVVVVLVQLLGRAARVELGSLLGILGLRVLHVLMLVVLVPVGIRVHVLRRELRVLRDLRMRQQQ